METGLGLDQEAIAQVMLDVEEAKLGKGISCARCGCSHSNRLRAGSPTVDLVVLIRKLSAPRNPLIGWGQGSGSSTNMRLRPDEPSRTTRTDHQDYLGAVIRQTACAQATTATRQYDAFGLLVASSGTPQGPFGFAGGCGYQEDADSGLKLLGHRYYDPSTGRFLTRDPVKDGRNWYGYAGNKPTIAVDPDGHLLVCLVVGMMLLLGLALAEPADAPLPTKPPPVDPGKRDPRVQPIMASLLVMAGRPDIAGLVLTQHPGGTGTVKTPNQFNRDPRNPGLRWDPPREGGGRQHHIQSNGDGRGGPSLNEDGTWGHGGPPKNGWPNSYWKFMKEYGWDPGGYQEIE